MGRARIRGKGLPRRVYISRGWYFYVHPHSGKWHRLAREGQLSEMYKALSHVMAGEQAGTMGALFTRYRVEESPKKGVKTQISQRGQLGRLERWCGHLAPAEVTSQMVGRYLTERGKAISANREIALLSHVFTKAISRWFLAERNPCLGVERNTELPRRHKVTDLDLMRAWLLAKPWMRGLIALAYVAGQRKMDIARLRETDFGSRGLTLTQSKTGTELLLTWTPALRAAHAFALSTRPDKIKPIGRWLVCNKRGQHYTDRTIRREMNRVIDALEKQGGERFQFRDIRPRSATDHISGAHLGHKDPRVLDRHYRLGPKVVTPL